MGRKSRGTGKLNKIANECFARGDHEAAVRHYSAAIASCADKCSDPQAYTNRSASHYNLQAFPDAKEDALKALELDDSSAEAHVRAGMACVGLKEFASAIEHFDRALALEPSDRTQALKDSATVDAVHSHKTEGWPVSIKEIEGCGRGLVTEKRLKASDLIFVDYALCSVRDLRNARQVPSCDNCLRSLAPANDSLFPDALAQRYRAMWPSVENGPHGTGIMCSCGQRYCSPICQVQAWDDHHCVECIASGSLFQAFWALQKHFEKRVAEPDTEVSVLNCLRLAWRMFSCFVTRKGLVHCLEMEDLPGEVQKFYKDFHASEDIAQHHESEVHAACSAFCSGLNDTPNEPLSYHIRATITQLLGRVLGNHQSVSSQPYYEFRDRLECHFGVSYSLDGVASLPPRDYEAAQVLGTVEDASEKLLTRSTARGIAIFPIQHFMNHSCKPNVFVDGRHSLTHSIHIIAVEDIAPGEQLFISYLNEEMTATERASVFDQQWGFECHCDICDADAPTVRKSNQERLPLILCTPSGRVQHSVHSVSRKITALMQDIQAVPPVSLGTNMWSQVAFQTDCYQACATALRLSVSTVSQLPAVRDLRGCAAKAWGQLLTKLPLGADLNDMAQRVQVWGDPTGVVALAVPELLLVVALPTLKLPPALLQQLLAHVFAQWPEDSSFDFPWSSDRLPHHSLQRVYNLHHHIAPEYGALLAGLRTFGLTLFLFMLAKYGQRAKWVTAPLSLT
jgi:hypothetical protein